MNYIFLIFLNIIFQNLNDKIFDPGFNLSAPSKLAPSETNQLIFILGDWKISETTFSDDKETLRNGVSSITFMNRGHGYMERSYFYDNRKTKEHNISFFAFGKFTKKWMLGSVSEIKEAIEIYDGQFENEILILNTAVRFNGGPNVIFSKLSYTKKSDSQFTTVMEESIDYGKTWHKKRSRIYNKTDQKFKNLAPDFEGGNPERVEEAKQFDFLIGEGVAIQNILLPTGNWVKFPSKTTGAYTLNGKAIYEFNWYDVDKQNPESATSIIRIYNRNMRRWESLFYLNRTNSLLYFGGQKEGDSMVLHNFETNSANHFSKFVFYDIGKKQYKWFGENSTDSGKTFKRFWEIDVKL